MSPREAAVAHAAACRRAMMAGRGRPEYDGPSLVGADLSGTDLRSAYLRGADLRGANLSGADLARADLARADLSGADLSGTDLTDADLRYANLTRADLYRASLSRAILFGADLSRASSILYGGPVGDEGWTIYAVDHGDRVLVLAGRSWRTLEETVAAVEDRYADGTGLERWRAAYLAALRWCEAGILAGREVTRA